MQTSKSCLKHDYSYDLDGETLFEELKVIRHIITIEWKSSFKIFTSLKIFSCFPNACITYILTIPIAPVGRSFSKLTIPK